jgi:sugar porter (SP) family MFS transporter
MAKADEHGAPPAIAYGTHRHFRASMVFIVILMAFGSVAYAYSGGVIATTLGQPSFISYMGLDKSSNATALLGATGSLYYAGGFFGSLFSNWMADRYGRKPAILVGLIIVLLSAALCAGSVHIAMFIVFRLTSGFGALMLSMTVPLWISECVPPEVRGAFSQLHGSAVDLGYLLAGYIGVGFFFHVPDGHNAWRGPQALGCLFCLPLLVGLWFVPESPRFLLMKGREEEATNVVRRFHSGPGDTEHQFANMELIQMRKQIELDRTLPSSWMDIFKRPSYRKRLLMAIYLVFSIQATGSQVLTIYATTIFKNLGYSPAKQLLLQAGLFAMNWPLATICIFYTEKFRRPTLITAGMVGMTITLVCYTALIANFLNSENKSGQIAATAMVYIFFACYAAAVEGPFYYYTAEMFPTHLRAKGMALQATTFCWTSILWAQSGPTAIANIGWRYFIIFIVLTATGGAVIYFYFPDTRGKSLEEITALFGDDDLVVLYQRDIHLDLDHNAVVAEIQPSEGKAEITEKLTEAI